jgi:hypothetical protein
VKALTSNIGDDQMEHELEMAMKRISMLMQTGYLPRHMMADLQTIMNAAMAWEITHEADSGESTKPTERAKPEESTKEGERAISGESTETIEREFIQGPRISWPVG